MAAGTERGLVTPGATPAWSHVSLRPVWSGLASLGGLEPSGLCWTPATSSRTAMLSAAALPCSETLQEML